MKMDYKNLRNAYYLGIVLLIIYALPKIPFVSDYIRPVLEFNVLPGLPVISIVAIAMVFGVIFAYKYRRIG
jgi:hypothetical protein